MLRAGGTQAEAARAAGVGVSTIKRWLADPQFRAMVSSSPDIRLGPPPKVGQSTDVPDSRGDMRSQMWVSSESQEVIGSYIPPAVFERTGAVLHVHVVPSAEVADVTSAIGAGTYPTESPYIPVPLDGLAQLLENLPLVCRLGSRDERESLDAWLELWTFVDEDGRTSMLGDGIWDGQRRFLEALLSDRHVVSIKSRKVGLSTLACAHAAWTMRIRDMNAAVFLLSYREPAAQELLRTLKRGFEGLPAYLRLPLVRETSTVLSYAAGVRDQRSLKVFPATAKAAIEATTSHLVLDEWAHTFDPEAVWVALEPTLPARASSALITTARTPGDFVHDYWLRSEKGETRHRAVFVSALERPDRSPAWLEQKLREEGKWRALRNYPLTAEEAFSAAGEPYFELALLEAAQEAAPPPSTTQAGARYLKAWDIGQKDASVCVVLRTSAEDEPQLLHVVDYDRLVDEDFPTLQRAIRAMHSRYPGPTVVEANSIGKPVIENLGLAEGEVIEYTTTKATKLQMLTAIELHLQQRTLTIHRDFDQLFSELAAYREPEGSITQDSVMALGLAVANAEHAHARGSGRESVLDLEPFTDAWYDWYEARRLRSHNDLLNDNDARRDIIPPAERRARARVLSR